MSRQNDNQYLEQFLTAREARINRRISRHIMPLSIFIAPILWLGVKSGAFMVSDESLITFFAASVIVTVLVYLADGRKELVHAVKYIELTAAAALIFYMSVQNSLDLSLAYCIVPLLGCYFMTTGIFYYSLGLGYALMTISLIVRSQALWQAGCFDSRSAYILTYVPGYTIEYAFMAIILLVMTQSINDTLLRMQDEARLRELEKIKNETKSSFYASMSHDLRTPISAIVGYNELIRRSAGDKVTAERCDQISKACDSLLVLMNDVLDVSAMDSGVITVADQPFDLVGMLDELKSEMLPAAEDKGLSLSFEIAPDTPEKISCDRAALRRVLQNLLSNAIKYTLKGYVIFSLSVSESQSGVLYLSAQVADSGIGIKDEDQGTLLTNFRRLLDPQTASVPGTGLGLNICCRMLNAMGGQLKMESKYGHGSRFSFTIPVSSVPGAAPIGGFNDRHSDDDVSYAPSFTAPGARVLIVDDNEINCEILAALLESTRIAVDIADSGEKSISLSRENFYHVIIMDHQMPGMDGVAAMRALRQADSGCLNPNVKILALTANVFAGAREKYLSMGFDGYLAKPYQPEQVEDLLKKSLPAELVEAADI